MFKKILLAVSPQVDAETAPRAAFDLAREHSAELIIYHALPLGTSDWCSVDDVIPQEEVIKATEKSILHCFEHELKDISNHSVRVVVGPSHDQLMKIVHGEGVDLIVMGHHTSNEVQPGRMWGAVDTSIRKICSNVYAPVLVVTQDAPKVTNIKRIIMTTDFSTPSDSALCYAIQVAQENNAHLEIFHVLDIGLSTPNPQYYMQEMDTFVNAAKEKMKKKYSRALEGISYSLECWEGVPYAEILKKARWSEADLVIMAQYSTSQDIPKPGVGSTVIQVALSPGCPALIVNYRARNCLQ